MGGERRWRGERHPGLGEDVAERHVEDRRRAEVHLRVRRPALAGRGWDGVRDLRRAPRRRLCDLRVHHDRFWQHLAIDREQPAEGRGGARDRGGSEEPRSPVPGHRDRPVGVLEQGRAVDAPQGQPADDSDLRDQDSSARQRPDPGHARARHLDSRRSRHRRSSGRRATRRRPRTPSSRIRRWPSTPRTIR